jgi:hypothetical protein
MDVSALIIELGYKQLGLHDRLDENGAKQCGEVLFDGRHY